MLVQMDFTVERPVQGLKGRYPGRCVLGRYVTGWYHGRGRSLQGRFAPGLYPPSVEGRIFYRLVCTGPGVHRGMDLPPGQFSSGRYPLHLALNKLVITGLVTTGPVSTMHYPHPQLLVKRGGG